VPARKWKPWKQALDTAAFPQGWWFGRPASDDGDEQGFSGHHPYARPVRGGWTQDATQHWQYSSEDPMRWEVICEECGDHDGPVEIQSDQVCIRRGPYDNKRLAESAATSHFEGAP
jgi:hypothetical protein